ncbi:MAG: Ig domain-containing protein [Ilumatobacteraceae bacterium]
MPWSGGLGGANNYSSPTNAGGGGGAGLCGGGGGAPDIAGSLTSSGGGAGLSYGATFDGCAAPTYVATPAAPGVSYRWITMATTPTQYTTAGTTVSYTYAATFGPLGTVGSSINGDYAVVAGSLPTGMTLDPATGVVSGRPYFGQYPFTLQATVRGSDGTIIARSRHAYLINVASGGSSEFQP